MGILELPVQRPSGPRAAFDFATLSNVLFESADMLEESRETDDAEFRTAAVELAIRSLYTASAAIDRFVAAQLPPPGAARKINGPFVRARRDAGSSGS